VLSNVTYYHLHTKANFDGMMVLAATSGVRQGMFAAFVIHRGQVVLLDRHVAALDSAVVDHDGQARFQSPDNLMAVFAIQAHVDPDMLFVHCLRANLIAGRLDAPYSGTV